jgi:hypothetical protein
LNLLSWFDKLTMRSFLILSLSKDEAGKPLGNESAWLTDRGRADGMGALIRPGIQMTATPTQKETVAILGAGSSGVAWSSMPS